MNNLLLLILLLIGLILGSFITWFITNKRTNARNRMIQERTKNALLQLGTRLDELERQFQQEKGVPNSIPAERSTLPTQLETIQQNYAELHAQLSALQSQIDT